MMTMIIMNNYIHELIHIYTYAYIYVWMCMYMYIHVIFDFISIIFKYKIILKHIATTKTKIKLQTFKTEKKKHSLSS